MVPLPVERSGQGVGRRQQRHRNEAHRRPDCETQRLAGEGGPSVGVTRGGERLRQNGGYYYLNSVFLVANKTVVSKSGGILYQAKPLQGYLSAWESEATILTTPKSTVEGLKKYRLRM